MKVWIVRGYDSQRNPSEIWGVFATPEAILAYLPLGMLTANGEQLAMGGKAVAKVEPFDVHEEIEK